MAQAFSRFLVRVGIRKVAEPPEARVVREGDQEIDVPDPMRWVRRGVFLGLLAIGWVFILWQNKFYVSAPVVFVGLGYLAVLASVVTLWRTGASVVDDGEDEDDAASWGRPLGARGELEREKRTLLKAIKEAEFDREMGKLSQADADAMIKVYRARAIEVIKELDKLDGATAGSVREQIEREVKARVEIDAKTQKASEKASAEASRKKQKKGGKAAAKADAKAEDAKLEAKPDGDSGSGSGSGSGSADDAKAEAKADEDSGSGSGSGSGSADDAKADAKAEDAKLEAKPDGDSGSGAGEANAANATDDDAPAAKEATP